MTTLVDLVTHAQDTHPLGDIEAALVRTYCHHHQLTPVPGSAAAAALAAPLPPDLLTALAGADRLDLDDLVSAFETLVPAADAAKYGAVFTPGAITSFMAEQLCDQLTATGTALDQATVVDPAVGCGALLVAVLRTIVQRTGARPATIAAHLSGVDISAQSVHRAQLLIEIACLALGDTTGHPQPDLHCGDTLTDNPLTDRTFDAVIGNPPYVRYQHLDDDQRAALRTNWDVCAQGNFNLYFPFFQVAHHLAGPGAPVVLITPNGYFTQLSGGALRTWLAATRFLDHIIDFGHHRVFHAMTYTAIVVASHKTAPHTHPTFTYTDVAGTTALTTLDPHWRARAATYPWAAHTARPWQLVGATKRAMIAQIRRTGRPLAEVATIRFGIATCRDRIYRLTGAQDADGNYVTTYDGVTYAIEPGATRRCIKVAGLTSEADLQACQTRIIYPYTLTATGAQIMPEGDLAATYPGTYRYLQAVRAELATRDRGRKTYPAWYAYARTQGLIPAGDKLLTPLYAGAPRFMRDPDPDAVFLNGCSVTAKDGTDLETLTWVLNSAICQLYIEATSNAISNGFYAYQKSQLAHVGVPTLTDEQRAQLRAATPTERDQLLAAIYGVTLPPRVTA